VSHTSTAMFYARLYGNYLDVPRTLVNERILALPQFLNRPSGRVGWSRASHW